MEIGLNDKEIRSYSLMRAIRALLPAANDKEKEKEKDAAAFEFECSRAAEKKYGKKARGILIPDEVLNRRFNDRTQINGSNEFLSDSFIEELRKRTTIMRLGEVRTGLVGNVAVPKNSGANAYWLSEGEDARPGSPMIEQITLSPKTVAVYSNIERSLMQQSSLDAESLVRQDLINALSQAIDQAGYYGTGSNKQPLGLKNYAGLSVVEFNGNPSFADIIKMESEVAASNGDINRSAYILNEKMHRYLKTTPKSTGGTATIWESGDTINGYRTEVTNQVENGDIFYGNFSDLVIGLWDGLDLEVDRSFSFYTPDVIRVVAYQSLDFAFRRLESFCYGRPSAKTIKA